MKTLFSILATTALFLCAGIGFNIIADASRRIQREEFDRRNAQEEQLRNYIANWTP